MAIITTEVKIGLFATVYKV